MVEPYVDIDVLKRTLRLMVAGPRRSTATRFEVVKCLLDAGLPGEKIKSVFRCEGPNTWFATLEDEQSVDKVVAGGDIKHSQFLLHPEPCDQRRLRIRVQWLPTWIDDEAISRYFHDVYGKVIAIDREMTEVSGVKIETGTRELTLIIREGDQDSIPHKARMFGKTALIMVPGRPPICLRCHEVGHVRSQCPGRPDHAPRSYASVTRPQGQHHVEPVTASPSAGGSGVPSVTASPSAGGSGVAAVTASPSAGGSGVPAVTASPSAGGSGVPGTGDVAYKRPVCDEEGFVATKKGRHHSPVILENGDLAPGQLTPSPYESVDMMDSDHGEGRLVIDLERS